MVTTIFVPVFRRPKCRCCNSSWVNEKTSWKETIHHSWQISLAERINLYGTELFEIGKYYPEDVRVKAISMIFQNGKEGLSIYWPHHPKASFTLGIPESDSRMRFEYEIQKSIKIQSLGRLLPLTLPTSAPTLRLLDGPPSSHSQFNLAFSFNLEMNETEVLAVFGFFCISQLCTSLSPYIEDMTRSQSVVFLNFNPNGIPLSPKDKTSLHMKCIIVCSCRPEDGHTDDRNM
jgi:hypothetical protein